MDDKETDGGIHNLRSKNNVHNICSKNNIHNICSKNNVHNIRNKKRQKILLSPEAAMHAGMKEKVVAKKGKLTKKKILCLATVWWLLMAAEKSSQRSLQPPLPQ